jgi:hypothetical protein
MVILIRNRSLPDGTKMVDAAGEWLRVRSVLPTWFWGALPMSIRKPWIDRKVSKGRAEVMIPIAESHVAGTMRPRRGRG